jgi:hypothetical protein
MRNSGGRTKSRGSLRGHPKGRAKRTRALHPAGKPAADSVRSGAAASDLRRPAVNRPKSKAATVASVALNTSSLKSTPKKKRYRLEAFVPLQRHLYGEEKVFLPCPESSR